MSEEPTTSRPGVTPAVQSPAGSDAQASATSTTDSGAPRQSSRAPENTSTRTVYRAPRRIIRITVPDGWARGLLSGFEAAIMGWALATLLALLTYWGVVDNPWMSGTEWSDAMKAGATLWGAVLGGSIVIPADVDAGTSGYFFHATPLLFTAIVVGVFRAFLLSGRHFPAGAHFFAVPAFVLTSAFLIAANKAWIGWGRFIFGAFVVAMVAVTWAYCADKRAGGALPLALRLTPTYGDAIVRGARWAGRGLGVLFVVAVALLGAGVVARWQAVSGISEVLMPASAWDATLLVVAQVLFVPNAAAWVWSWASGAGVSLGTDAFHSIGHATIAPIPPIPLLGVLPTQALGAGWIALLVVVSIACGVVWGRVVTRSVALVDEFVAVAVMLACSFVGVALWMYMSQMVLGSGRLGHVGPFTFAASGAVFGEILLPAAAAFVLSHPRVVAWVRHSVFGMDVREIEFVASAGADATEGAEKEKRGVLNASADASGAVGDDEAGSPDDASADSVGDEPTGRSVPDQRSPHAQAGTADEEKHADKVHFPVTGETPAGLMRLHDTPRSDSAEDARTRDGGDPAMRTGQPEGEES